MTVAAFGCVKNTIRLRSGGYFDYLNPNPEQFTIEDIAGALSKICRFGGQIEHFYSVAEHCCLCAAVAKDDGLATSTVKAALLHDATEAFCGDVVKPLKIMLSEYAIIEKRVEEVIGEKFGIDFEKESKFVAPIDHALLIAERHRLFSPDKVKWVGEDEVRRLAVRPIGWFPNVAEARFMEMWFSLNV